MNDLQTPEYYGRACAAQLGDQRYAELIADTPWRLRSNAWYWQKVHSMIIRGHPIDRAIVAGVTAAEWAARGE